MMDEDVIAAARAHDVARLHTLLAHGAPVDARDEHGWSALCWAAGAGATPVVRALLAHGADPRLTGHDGRTPYRIALAAARTEAAHLLAQAERAAGMTDGDARSGQESRTSYCRAFSLSELRPFAGWTIDAEAAAGAEPRSSGDIVLFVQADFSVTRTIWPGEERLYDGTAPAWRQFCVEHLAFRVPDDFASLPEPER